MEKSNTHQLSLGAKFLPVAEPEDRRCVGTTVKVVAGSKPPCAGVAYQYEVRRGAALQKICQLDVAAAFGAAVAKVGELTVPAVFQRRQKLLILS